MEIQTLEIGVLGGIIVKIIDTSLHKCFFEIQLPDAYAFFRGARFVPIITSIVSYDYR